METINGKMMAVETYGDSKDTVIMGHGRGGTSNTYHPQSSLLMRNFTVIRLDLEGSGRSPLQSKSLSIKGFANDIVALMAARKIRRSHLVGHSMGTIICQHIAASYPSRVASMVLLGPLAEPPAPAREVMRDRAKLARSNGMIPIADALLQVAISNTTRFHRPEIAAMVREILMRQTPEGYAATCEALSSAKSAALSKIKCRTLLITGDEDGVAPPAAVQGLSKSIKRSNVHILPECGHWTPIERAADVNALMANFYYG